MPKYGSNDKHLSRWHMLDNWPYKRQLLIVLALLGIIIFFGGAKYYELRLHQVKIEVEAPLEETSVQEETEPELQQVIVHVVGAVEKPGVYSLEEGKRIHDALQLAMPSEEADLKQVNLAAPLEDGRQIYVPAKGESPPAQAPYNAAGTPKGGLVNINTATAGQLDELPGIGPALAGRIIAYREKNGPFADTSEIVEVSGIGPVLYEKIKSRISVR